MDKNKSLKNILAAAAIPVFGFLLLNLTFILDWAFQSLLNRLIPMNLNPQLRWLPIARHLAFLLVILLISWPVLKSKIGVLFKAIYLTVPTAATLVIVGICFYQWPVFLYCIGILLYSGVIFYLYRRRMPWLYFYSVTLVAVALLLMGIFKVEI